MHFSVAGLLSLLVALVVSSQVLATSQHLRRQYLTPQEASQVQQPKPTRDTGSAQGSRIQQRSINDNSIENLASSTDATTPKSKQLHKSVPKHETARGLSTTRGHSTNYYEDDDAIVLSPTSKSLIKTGVRFYLEQSSISKMVKVESALVMVDELSSRLMRKSSLLMGAKMAAVGIVSFLLMSLAFPKPAKVIEESVELIYNADKNFNQSQIVDVVSRSADGLLESVGFQDTASKACGGRSVCMISEIFKCTFPKRSKQIAGVAENLAPELMQAFENGLKQFNCAQYQLDQSCPANKTDL